MRRACRGRTIRYKAMKVRKRNPAKKPISCLGEKNKNEQNVQVTTSRQIRWLKDTAPLVGTFPSSRTIPRINPILAMFDPIIFPSINPVELLRIAEREVNSSGDEVAMDTMVNPTATGGTPSLTATFALWSLNQSPPFMSR